MAALSWACTTILMKKAMTGENPMFHFTSLCGQVVGLLIQTPAVIWEYSQVGFPTDASLEGWAWLAFLAIFSTVLSYVWFADGIRIIGAGRSAMYVYLVPIFGILVDGYCSMKIGAFTNRILHSNCGWSLPAQSKQPSST